MIRGAPATGLVAALALFACDAPPDNAAGATAPGGNVTPPVAAEPARTPPSPPDGFRPLQSQRVQDAIRAALNSGETQRWSDGAWNGYAVPSAPGANGCRAVSYTIDQRPTDPPAAITACGR